MDNQNEKDRCVNCGIRSVPLYLGLDNRLHCADHIGLLLPLVFVRVSPHASVVSVDVFRHGYRRNTLPTETLTAYYDSWRYSKSTVPTHSSVYRGTCLDTLCDVSDIVQRLHDLLEEVTNCG